MEKFIATPQTVNSGGKTRPITFADVTDERLCARILERHRETVRVQKDRLAIPKLVKIVNAALQLSNRQGFHAMSLRDLSRESGVSMGGLYSYFDSKITLLTMILAEVSATVLEVLENPPESVASDPGDYLDWLIETHIRLTEVMQPWFVFAFMEAKSFPPHARKIAIDSEAATENILTVVLAKGAESGRFSIHDPTLTAALIKPLLQDWYVKRSKYRRRGIEIDDYVSEVTRFVHAATHAPL